MHVVIIGNGIAGVTAALRVRRRRRDWAITLVSGESPLFYSRPALMYVFMGSLRLRDTMPHPERFFAEQRIERVFGWVQGIDTAAQRVFLANAPPLPYDALLLATGSRPRRLGWPGQDLQGVQGFYDLRDLARLENSLAGVRRAVIVGGGLIGVELAEMLRSRGLAVTMLVREASYWRNVLPAEDSGLVNDAVRAHGVELRFSSELAAIEGDAAGRAAAVLTLAGERILCQLVGLCIGVAPDLSATSGAAIPSARGILVDESFATRVPNIYAAGDCAELAPAGAAAGRLEQLWYTGKQHGLVAGDVIAGERRAYERGVWFNSAKFFDLEWQTYGRVPAEPEGGRQRHHFWRHPSAAVALRVVTEDGVVIGVNALGLRQRQAVWEKWIREGRSLTDVSLRLREANFDPELFRAHEPAIARAFAGGTP